MATLLLCCRDRESVDRHYIPAVRLGGWTQAIQLLMPGEALPHLGSISGLLLTGGADIHPRHWDVQEPVHPTAKVDEERDHLEIPLTRTAWDQNLPILAICRGEQLLNVALGGSLIQDIPSYYGCPSDLHRRGSGDDPVLCHRVNVDPTSCLAEILGTTNPPVNSRHHQAVHRMAPGLKAVAWHKETIKDGASLIEGLEAVDPVRWVVGVQWHPENLVSVEGEAGEAARNLFQGFVEALKKHI
jgi:putative glutamine amidotransferase